MSVVSSNGSDVNATRYLDHCHFHRYQTSSMASDRFRIFSLPRLECVVRWPWTKRIWKSRVVLQSSRTQKFSATHAFVANKGLKSNVQKLTLAKKIYKPRYSHWENEIRGVQADNASQLQIASQTGKRNVEFFWSVIVSFHRRLYTVYGITSWVESMSSLYLSDFVPTTIKKCFGCVQKNMFY